MPKPILFVIDASIARSSGAESATAPSAVDCRKFLIQIMQIPYKLAWDSEIGREWKKHSSTFARKWLIGMFARKMVVKKSETIDKNLREKLGTFLKSESDRRAALKDVHLIELAIATNNRIASLDDSARKIFSSVSPQIKEVSEVLWINPQEDFTTLESWLKDGAPVKKERKLGQYT